ncbi:serine/threonine-protein kinase PknD [Mycolicibacter arupensis]|uniref:non-specific serine/threonine protein kinase n=1 Tax=Mycolicibacter arupensis TaxID=342002 RepID=A0A0F5MZI8_9MYCO|nr:serine/threonine-protein kinase PknD [Mycolicibacter arupensis]KKC00199.1 serine/threonine protein kinase [Mycolicibacter arupensis]MCV7276138.1 protein kinase [Mycolicibacter arupensis]ORA01261.1 serine/threonine protein kinase [Mycolicibacter arupensis]
MNKPEPGSRTGSRFGPYQLGRLLGHDAVGDVYLAEDTRHDETVALKLISEELSADAAFRGRLEDEAEAAGQLTEPHVVPIRAYGEIDGVLYLETGLIDGTDLATVLADSGPLSPPRAVAIVRQLAAALDAAHNAYVVHRDVKPATALVTRDDLAYLVDFGVAAALAEPGARAKPSAGTLAYMAPERLTGEQVTHLADIYSLACVLAEALSGVPPFSAQTVDEAIEERRTAELPQPSRLRPGRVPAAIDAVLARGLARKPEERYSSAGELAAAAYHALTEPERHQVSRILRRGEPALHLPGGLEPEPRLEFRGGTALSAGVSRAGWTPAEAGFGAAWEAGLGGSAPAPFPMSPLLRGDLHTPPAIPTPSRRWRRPSKPVLVAAAAVAVVTVIAGIGHLASQPSSATPVAAPPQDVLPFTDLEYRLSPGGVALDGDGNVYVASEGMHGRVVRLAADSTASTVMPFSDQYQPRGLVVDSAGNVYFSDVNSRVVKLGADSNTHTVLPFAGLDDPDGVAVDSEGNVYVADRGNDVVLRLDAVSNVQTTVPFVGLNKPDGVAVDSAGNVYVTDTGNNRVLKLVAASGEQVVLPFAGIVAPWGIAVDEAGDVYVTEHNRNKVVKLAAGAAIPVVLPFTGLNAPLDVAVDKHGGVYVADRGNDRVVKVDTDS